MPIDEARRQARAAAEKRRVQSKNSGQRLGGARVLRGTNMRKLRADAAQRRIEVMNGCASGTDREVELVEEESKNGFRTKAEEEDANDEAILQAFIELIQEEEREKYGSSYVPPSQENPAGPRTQESSSQQETSTQSATQKPEPILLESDPEDSEPKETPEASASAPSHANNSSYDAPWACSACTLENPPNFLCCEVCSTERPIPASAKESQLPSRIAPKEGSRAGLKNPRKRDASKVEERDLPARDTFAFKNRTRASNTLVALDQDTSKKPLGWVCSCGTFMETQWWTCSLCGLMKPSS